MQLTIKLLQSNLAHGNTLQISVESFHKISDVKEIISEALDISPASLRLLMIREFAEILLTDDETLETYNIIDGNKLILDVFNDDDTSEIEQRSSVKPRKTSSDQQQPVPPKD